MATAQSLGALEHIAAAAAAAAAVCTNGKDNLTGSRLIRVRPLQLCLCLLLRQLTLRCLKLPGY